MAVSSSNLAGRVAVFGACALGLLLLASLFVPDSSRAAEEATTPAPRSLGALEAVDYRVEIEAGPDGPRYTVMTPAGEVLGRSLTQAEVESQFPDVDLRGVGPEGERTLMWVDPADH